jgi:hypothetical protein
MENKIDLEALYQDAHTDFCSVREGILLLILAELKELNHNLKCQK